MHLGLLKDKTPNRGSVRVLNRHIEKVELQIIDEILLIGREYPSYMYRIGFLLIRSGASQLRSLFPTYL